MTLAEFVRACIAEDEADAKNARYDPAEHWWLPDYADPERVLAECETKRRIVEVCQDAMAAGEIKPGTTWNDDAAGAAVAREILQLMAQPYAEHPDFDESWRL